MASMFDIITENAILSAKTAILEEAAGTQTGERYVYIIESAGDTLKKAKDFVVNNKGKLAALAGAAALAGGAYEAHKHNWGGVNDLFKKDETPQPHYTEKQVKKLLKETDPENGFKPGDTELGKKIKDHEAQVKAEKEAAMQAKIAKEVGLTNASKNADAEANERFAKSPAGYLMKNSHI